jgi:signal transduction histidine kinase
MVDISKMTNEHQKALAIMAHDLKAPLSAIIDLLDVINKGYVEDVAKMKDLVARATQKAENLIAMLDDILDYTLLTNRELMKSDPLDLFDILEESISTMKPYIKDRHIILTCKKQLTGQKKIQGNYTFLLRVFNNIFMNAIKYNKENGEIIVDFFEDTRDNTVNVIISDTGIGIPEEDMDKIFRIFERGKNARRNINGSLGLGLSLVKQIIEDHKGEIEVTSTVGVGTKIVVTLPLLKRGGTNEF